MISALSVIAVFGIIVFLSGAAFGAFILLIISMRRTARTPLSEALGKRTGTISRRVLLGTGTDAREIGQRNAQARPVP